MITLYDIIIIFSSENITIYINENNKLIFKFIFNDFHTFIIYFASPQTYHIFEHHHHMIIIYSHI